MKHARIISQGRAAPNETRIAAVSEKARAQAARGSEGASGASGAGSQGGDGA